MYLKVIKVRGTKIDTQTTKKNYRTQRDLYTHENNMVTHMKKKKETTPVTPLRRIQH